MESNNTDGIKFFGADTHEWIGVVLSDEAQKEQVEGTGGYGVRYKVAIMGHHPTDQTQVKDEDIQYAMVLFGVTDGDGGANTQASCAIREGSVVRGKFLDGSARQMPEITGVYGKTSGTRFGKGRFDAKDGFGGNLKPGNLLGRDTTNETSSPPCVPRALPGADDKTKKRETPKEALKAAGVDPDGEAKVAESPALKNNDLDAEAQREILKEQQTGTVKEDPGPASNTVPTEEVETREQRNARVEAQERAAAQRRLAGEEVDGTTFTLEG